MECCAMIYLIERLTMVNTIDCQVVVIHRFSPDPDVCLVNGFINLI